MMNVTPNGRIVDWTRDVYDADTERERSTQLKTFTESQGPRAVWDKWINPQEKTYDQWHDWQPKVNHFVMGNLAHELILEGEVNFKGTTHKRGSRAWQKLAEKRRQGTWIVSATQEKELYAWQDAVDANSEAKELLLGDNGFKEAIILWDEVVTLPTGETLTVPCKAAIDNLMFNGTTIVCMKTAAVKDRPEFEKHIEKFSYHFSAAFYGRARSSLPEFNGTRFEFKQPVIFKGDADHRPACYVWTIGQEWLTVGDLQCQQALAQVAICRREHKRLESLGQDPIAAWPDAIARTQGDPIIPDPWMLERQGIAKSLLQPETVEACY